MEEGAFSEPPPGSGGEDGNHGDSHEDVINWVEFTENTTFHGIKYIFDNKPYGFRRALWFMCVVAAVGVFTYAGIVRFADYRQHSATVNMKVTYPATLDFPAVTICNQNSQRLTKAVEYRLYDYIDRFFSNDQNLERFGSLNHINTSEFVSDAAHRKDDFIDKCVWKKKDCRAQFRRELTDAGICYTFRPDHRAVTSPGSRFGLRLVLNVEQYEYMKNDQDDVGVKVLLHNPLEKPQIRDQGFVVEPGKHTLVAIKIIKFVGIGEPYDGTSKIAEPLTNCQLDCEAAHQKKICKCTNVYMTRNETDPPICGMRKQFECILSADNNRTSNADCPCLVPSERESYETRLSTALLSKYNINQVAFSQPGSRDVTKINYIRARDTAQRALVEVRDKNIELIDTLWNHTQQLLTELRNYSEILNNASTLAAHGGTLDIFDKTIRDEFTDTRVVTDKMFKERQAHFQSLPDAPNLGMLYNMIDEMLQRVITFPALETLRDCVYQEQISPNQVLHSSNEDGKGEQAFCPKPIAAPPPPEKNGPHPEGSVDPQHHGPTHTDSDGHQMTGGRDNPPHQPNQQPSDGKMIRKKREIQSREGSILKRYDSSSNLSSSSNPHSGFSNSSVSFSSSPSVSDSHSSTPNSYNPSSSTSYNSSPSSYHYSSSSTSYYSSPSSYYSSSSSTSYNSSPSSYYPSSSSNSYPSSTSSYYPSSNSYPSSPSSYYPSSSSNSYYSSPSSYYPSSSSNSYYSSPSSYYPSSNSYYSSPSSYYPSSSSNSYYSSPSSYYPSSNSYYSSPSSYYPSSNSYYSSPSSYYPSSNSYYSSPSSYYPSSNSSYSSPSSYYPSSSSFSYHSSPSSYYPSSSSNSYYSSPSSYHYSSSSTSYNSSPSSYYSSSSSNSYYSSPSSYYPSSSSNSYYSGTGTAGTTHVTTETEAVTGTTSTPDFTSTTSDYYPGYGGSWYSGDSQSSSPSESYYPSSSDSYYSFTTDSAYKSPSDSSISLTTDYSDSYTSSDSGYSFTTSNYSPFTNSPNSSNTDGTTHETTETDLTTPTTSTPEFTSPTLDYYPGYSESWHSGDSQSSSPSDSSFSDSYYTSPSDSYYSFTTDSAYKSSSDLYTSSDSSNSLTTDYSDSYTSSDLDYSFTTSDAGSYSPGICSTMDCQSGASSTCITVPGELPALDEITMAAIEPACIKVFTSYSSYTLAQQTSSSLFYYNVNSMTNGDHDTYPDYDQDYDPDSMNQRFPGPPPDKNHEWMESNSSLKDATEKPPLTFPPEISGECNQVKYLICNEGRRPRPPGGHNVTQALSGFRARYMEEMVSIFDNKAELFSDQEFHKKCLFELDKLDRLTPDLVSVYEKVVDMKEAKTVQELMDALGPITNSSTQIRQLLDEAKTVDMEQCMWFKRYWLRINGKIRAEADVTQYVQQAQQANVFLLSQPNEIHLLGASLKSIRNTLNLRIMSYFNQLMRFKNRTFEKSVLTDKYDTFQVKVDLTKISTYMNDFTARARNWKQSLGMVNTYLTVWYKYILKSMMVPLVTDNTVKELPVVKAISNVSSLNSTLDAVHKDSTKAYEIPGKVISPLEGIPMSISQNLSSVLSALITAEENLRDNLDSYSKANKIADTFFMENFLQLDLYYPELSFQTIEYQEAFTFVSLLSEIGGFMGLLLGASVLTVCEVADFIFLQCINACGPKKAKKHKK